MNITELVVGGVSDSYMNWSDIVSDIVVLLVVLMVVVWSLWNARGWW